MMLQKSQAETVGQGHVQGPRVPATALAFPYIPSSHHWEGAYHLEPHDLTKDP